MKTSPAHTMVPLLAIAGAILTVTGGCSSTSYTRVQDDDVYYARTDAPAPVATGTYPSPSGSESTSPEDNRGGDEYYDENYRTDERVSGETQPASTTESHTDGSGNTYITNNYYGNRYDADDYYDYAYSARIRRFHSSCGFSYYDPWYTNMYWYTHDPYHWGVSIYYGYRWWRPYPSVWISYGHPWHYGYYPGGYWSGYNSGYWHGYHDGYNNGYYGSNYNPYYYNSRDLTTRHYGPRKTIGTNGRSAGPTSLGEKYETYTALDRQKAPEIKPGTPVNRNNPGTAGLSGNDDGKPGDARPKPSLPEQTGTRPEPPGRVINTGRTSDQKPNVGSDTPRRTGTYTRPETPRSDSPRPDARPAAEPRPEKTYTPQPRSTGGNSGNNRPSYTQPRHQPAPPRESTPRPAAPRSDNHRPGSGHSGSTPSYSGGSSSYSRPSSGSGGHSSGGRSSSPSPSSRPSPR